MGNESEDAEAANLSVSMAAAGPTNASASVRMRSYLSTHHLCNARHQAEMAAAVEAAHQGPSRFDVRHRGYVMSAVFSAAGFLEALINELFSDAVDGHGTVVAALPPSAAANLAALWRVSDGRARLLEKFQSALIACGRPAFDASREPYQNVVLLVGLRNGIVHYVPETFGPDDVAKVARQLQAEFEPNPLMEDSANPVYPDKLLSAGCALWSVRVAERFADAFFRRIDTTPNYQIATFSPAQ